MKNIRFVWLLLPVMGIAWILGSSCTDNSSPTGMGGGGGGGYGGGPTPTPGGTMAAVTVTAMPSGGSYVYSPSSFTITHGQSVMWNLSSIHPLNIDDGSGACQVSGTTAFPYTYTFMTAGTYHFHCGVHSTCGNGMCPNPSTCTGMVGTVTVN